MGHARIGIPRRDYNVQRNIVDSLPAWACARRPLDRHRATGALRSRLRLPARSFDIGAFSDPYWPRVDLLHLFNAVGFTSTPWICTFETMLPRWGNVVLPDWDITDQQLGRATRAMAGDSCKKLLAISESARALVLRRWSRRVSRDLLQALEAKVAVLRPPQRILVDADARGYSSVPRLAFVGSEFYRKGGLAFLEALHRLHGRGIRTWSAVIVGRLGSFGDHATRSDASAERRARDLLDRLAPLVSHVESLPKADIIGLFGESDFAVLPSLQDSFGYGVLEAQACGAVTITTNIRAMPEMHRDGGGLLMELPLDPDREVHHDAAAMPRVISDLVDRLEHALETAIGMPVEACRARACVQQGLLRERYDPVAHRAALERIYRVALGLSP
jgi:glycosyltransferase involved in cell wall biosynthesis